MHSKSQEKFLRWAESKNERWPQVKNSKFKVALLDLAIQEGVAHYLRRQDITPLRQFLETAAALISPPDAERISRPSLPAKVLPPSEANRVRFLNVLCEFYGFTGEFKSAWKTCVVSGLDCEPSKYLTFGFKCTNRQFYARQAYFFSLGDPPLTQAGRKQKPEIFPLVNKALKVFEFAEGKNLFDFYLDIAQAIFNCCSTVRDLEHLRSPKGEDPFERKQFQDRIIAEYQQQFEAGLKPFEDRLKTVFEDPAEYLKIRGRSFERFKSGFIYPFQQRREFLHRHFYEVCRSGESYGLRIKRFALEKIYEKGQHQVFLPFFPALIEHCMERHIAKIFRNCEDQFRHGLGLRGVGQGWVSEAALFAQLKQAFPQEIVLHHAKPDWIGRQHLDIYFPRLNVAIEYQGVQHQQPVAIFGGEAAFLVRKQLDKKKKELCKANTCLLIEVLPSDPIDSIIAQIKNQTELATVDSSIIVEVPLASIVKTARALNPNDNPETRTSKTASHRKNESWKENLGKDDLAACARHGDQELIRRLAKERANLKGFRNGEKETLLFIACKEGRLETAAALLEVGLNPNARDWRRASILSKICNRRRITPRPEIVRLLLEQGADPKLHGTLTPAIFDRCGYALPMNGCCIDGFLDCAQVLYEWTRTVNQQQTRSLLTPMMCACHRFDRHQHSHRSLEMLQWLISKGADLEMRSRIGCTPMDFALGASWYQPMTASNAKAEHIASKAILELLQNAGARPSEPFKHLLEMALRRL